jgi:CheY-like chemotaxis protein
MRPLRLIKSRSMRRLILMVDDDTDMHFIYRRVFQKLGIGQELRLFENGEEAIEFLSDSAAEVKLIFSDVNMPVMDGITLRRTIAMDEHLGCRSIPFIFLSTSARDEEVRTAYELTVQGFFEKGDTMQEIENTIRIALQYWGKCRLPFPITNYHI